MGGTQKGFCAQKPHRVLFGITFSLKNAYCIWHMRACVRSRLLQCVRLFATTWTTGHQAPLSMGFSRQEYWSEFPCPPPGDLPDPGVEPRSPPLQMDSLTTEPPGKPFDLGLTLSIASSRHP